MAVARSVYPNSHLNGRCFVCGKAAEVNPDRDHATGYRCDDCGSYDLVEKDRELFEAWIQSGDRLARLQMGVKFNWFTRGAYDMRVFLYAEWLRKLTLTRKVTRPALARLLAAWDEVEAADGPAGRNAAIYRFAAGFSSLGSHLAAELESSEAAMEWAARAIFCLRRGAMNACRPAPTPRKKSQPPNDRTRLPGQHRRRPRAALRGLRGREPRAPGSRSSSP